MGFSVGDEIIAGLSVGGETLGGLSVGDEIIWQLGGLGSMFFNIKNPAYVYLSSDMSISSNTWTDIISTSYTPTDTNAQVGVLITASASSGPDIRFMRGSTIEIPQTRASSNLFTRQLFFIEPNTTSQETYTLQAHFAATPTVRKGTCFMLFEADLVSGTQNLDIVTSSISVPSTSTWTDIASVSVTPTSNSSMVYLRNLVQTSVAHDFRIIRDSTELIMLDSDPDPQEDPDIGPLGANFEDFVDSPNTTNEVTYKVQSRSSFARTVNASSFLFASVLPE